MGRQFSFFLGPEDFQEFEDVLRGVDELIFLKDRPLSSHAEVLPVLSREGFRTLLARSLDAQDIAFGPVRNQKFFSADTFTQNYVECDVISEMRDGWLLEGRLYLVAQYWDALDQKVWKPDAFLDWGARLFRAVKRSLTRVDGPFYAGRHALQLRSEGAQFQQLDGWPRS